jgi:hypothetical protein
MLNYPKIRFKYPSVFLPFLLLFVKYSTKLYKILSNGLSICDVAEIEFRQSNLAQKLNSSTSVEPLTSSCHIENTLLAVRALYTEDFVINDAFLFFKNKPQGI